MLYCVNINKSLCFLFHENTVFSPPTPIIFCWGICVHKDYLGGTFVPATLSANHQKKGWGGGGSTLYFSKCMPALEFVLLTFRLASNLTWSFDFGIYWSGFILIFLMFLLSGFLIQNNIYFLIGTHAFCNILNFCRWRHS